MIAITYRQLSKFGACRQGKSRFADGRWFRTVILGQPVTLREIIEGQNNDSDVFWLTRRLLKAIRPAQLFAIAQDMYDILKKHGLQDADTDVELTTAGHVVNMYQFDMRWFVKSIKLVIEEYGLAGSRGLESVISHVIQYRSRNLGVGHWEVATKIYDALLDAPIDINWDYNNYRCRPCGE